MIIVELSCGLGNQMFQYAIGRRIAHFHNVPLILDYTKLSVNKPDEKHPYKRPFNLDIFCIPKEIERKKSFGAIRIIKKSSKLSSCMPLLCKLMYSTDFVAEKEVYGIEEDLILSPPKNIYLRGYWQSEYYFKAIAPIIRENFSFADDILPISNKLYDSIQHTNSVCVHIRRGDYVGSEFDILPLEYFSRAIKTIQAIVQDACFYVFCEDLEWCKKNLLVPTNSNLNFVERIHNGELNSNCFQLMARCKHFIISNSSFSWWAAWLGKHKEKIILSPNRWKSYPVNIDNIVPSSWKKLIL